MTTLTKYIQTYLTMRRSLGYHLVETQRYLGSYTQYLDAKGLETITIDSAVAWATSVQAQPQTWARRLGVIRLFAQYLYAFEPATPLIPANILPTTKAARLEPYVYARHEITALMAATHDITRGVLPATQATLIGLLASTGMRVGEALRLDTQDVDFQHHRITIRHAKYDNPRIVPIDATTSLALQDYLHQRQDHIPVPQSEALFVSSVGNRVIYANFQRAFHKLTQYVGLIPHSARCRPRIHDLRHTFAITTLIRWHQTGTDLNEMLPVLADYLGHISPASTYWYLTATPALMHAAAQYLPAAGEY